MKTCCGRWHESEIRDTLKDDNVMLISRKCSTSCYSIKLHWSSPCIFFNLNMKFMDFLPQLNIFMYDLTLVMEPLVFVLFDCRKSISNEQESVSNVIPRFKNFYALQSFRSRILCTFFYIT